SHVSDAASHVGNAVSHVSGGVSHVGNAISDMGFTVSDIIFAATDTARAPRHNAGNYSKSGICSRNLSFGPPRHHFDPTLILILHGLLWSGRQARSRVFFGQIWD
ncbi:MAG: hypothetical protein KDM91_04185, partial [Verrucomicrobiae bacterium]|nr:hypothetical protein [Verrucomicrobiae bacterium]